jgi:hypothetical protein
MSPGDWCGNSRREQGSCPSGPNATRTIHFVLAGTNALVKKAGDEKWRPFTVTQDRTFNRPYKETDKAFIYQQDGWLLCVKKALVRIESQDASNRFG